jgi:MarR family
MPTESTTGGTGLRDRADGTWTLLTGHGHVLAEIARNNRAPTRGIAAAAGLTQRTVHAIITDLEAAGYLTRKRNGRRTIYTIHPDRSGTRPGGAAHRSAPGTAGIAPQPRRRCRRPLGRSSPAGGRSPASTGVSQRAGASLADRPRRRPRRLTPLITAPQYQPEGTI